MHITTSKILKQLGLNLIFLFFHNKEKVPVRRTGAFHYKKALLISGLSLLELLHCESVRVNRDGNS